MALFRPPPVTPPDTPETRQRGRAMWVVVGSAAAVVVVLFALALTGVLPTGGLPPSFQVDFFEKGLPASTNWSVTFGGTTKSAPAEYSEISFVGYLAGEYAYKIGPVSGYTPDPASGNVTLNGSTTVNGPIAIYIDFQPSFPAPSGAAPPELLLPPSNPPPSP
jgi:hypothetical protein